MPSSLLESLRSIPVAVPSPGPVDGVTVDPVTGRVVRTDEHARSGHHRPWRFRFLGASALVAGLAVGALVVGAEQQDRNAVSPNGHLVGGVTTPFVVPPGHLLVFGDNRNDSNDGHHWHIEKLDGTSEARPFLPRPNVLGKAMVIFWPPQRAGLLTQAHS